MIKPDINLQLTVINGLSVSNTVLPIQQINEVPSLIVIYFTKMLQIGQKE